MGHHKEQLRSLMHFILLKRGCNHFLLILRQAASSSCSEIIPWNSDFILNRKFPKLLRPRRSWVRTLKSMNLHIKRCELFVKDFNTAWRVIIKIITMIMKSYAVLYMSTVMRILLLTCYFSRRWHGTQRVLWKQSVVILLFSVSQFQCLICKFTFACSDCRN